MNRIIILGRCCRISFDLIKLGYKRESSIFEWLWTDTLNEINIILKKLLNNEEINIKRINGNDYLEDTNIKSSHYINTDYKSIFKRRSNRFIEDIKGNNNILFIRDDGLDTIKYEEICEFNSIIKQFNPNLQYKFLLLSSSNGFKQIECENLYHRVYNTSLYEQYINECYIIEKPQVVDTNCHS